MFSKPLPIRIVICLLIAALALTAGLYWSGLSGSWLFDDFPNIVDNKGVQPKSLDLASITRAVLSSPSSEFKRPLASLSFALNFYAGGLDPFWMKLTNLFIHLLNGVLALLLSRALLRHAPPGPAPITAGKRHKQEWIALYIAAGWMLLPINLTAVLYVVQRMESLANVFVLLGLLGYIAGRRRMLSSTRHTLLSAPYLACLASITIPTVLGLLAKETAVMLPLYALLIEWALFGFRAREPQTSEAGSIIYLRDVRIVAMFLVVLVIPGVLGLAWLLPKLLLASAWATRDFDMATRLLSEARIVTSYITWTLFPTSQALSFYHDDFAISTGLLNPRTTLASIVWLVALAALAIYLRRRRPLTALGIALYLGAHLLTATILPLELIYEHRNYFASFGLLLAVVTALTVPPVNSLGPVVRSRNLVLLAQWPVVVLGALMAWWATQTAMTAYSWGDTLRLARELAERDPASPRAQYELGRTYIIYSHYDPASPFTKLAYEPLEKASSLPKSSILPQQALLFMNARMRLPLKDAWWDTMTRRLETHKPGVQDESSLASMTQCMRNMQCDFPTRRMNEAFQAAISHPNPSARLLATYADYAWNSAKDRPLGLSLMIAAVKTQPVEPAYRVTLGRMFVDEKDSASATVQLKALKSMNSAGHLDSDVSSLSALIDQQRFHNAHEPSGAKD